MLWYQQSSSNSISVFGGPMNMYVTKFRTPLDFVDRRWERTYLSFETILSGDGNLCMPVRVINFSEGGFLIACDHKVKSGDLVVLELIGVGAVTGRVAWAAQGRVGGTFEDKLKVADLIAALEADERQAVIAS